MRSEQLASVVLLLPLASAAVIALFLRRNAAVAAAVSVGTCFGIAGGALMLALSGQTFEASMEWLRIGDFALSIGYKFDSLAALMISIVGVVGLCVHVFSLGYMRDDSAKPRYFAGLSIFMFSMLGIVLADNLFMMFIFWELVGFSSYVLINHYLDRTSAADAAKKAFIVNRVGDFGFLLGIILCYWLNGTVSLAGLEKQHVFSTAIPLLLFCGAVGKSAQMPLHVWLPDAMEGPTPVSALIHAATMVAAGIYMLCRIEFLMVPQAQEVILWVGVVTAIYSALCAITQRDIKKVLAYSTLSQLGFMVAAFGLGSSGTAMFHLTTHAFFKALLFLGSGAVIHGCHHEQDIFAMGGLRKKMPLTFVTFTIGVLAIIGMPLLAGFFSKDAILALAYEKNVLVFAILAFTAVLTAVYMVRLWRIVFFGEPRSESAGHAHEGGIFMTAPLVVLAILSVIGGYRTIYPRSFSGILESVYEPEAGVHTLILATSVLVMAIGVMIGWVGYKPAAKDALEVKSPGFFGLLRGLKASFDRVYDYYVAKIQQRFAMLLNFLEQIALAGVIIRGAAGVVGLVGIGARALHVGNLHAYVYWFVIGVVLLWAYAAGVF